MDINSLKKRQALLKIHRVAYDMSVSILASRIDPVDRLDRLWKICAVANQKIHLAKNFDHQSLDAAVWEFNQLIKNL